MGTEKKSVSNDDYKIFLYYIIIEHEETVPAEEVRVCRCLYTYTMYRLKHLHPFARCPTVSITIITTVLLLLPTYTMIINNFSFSPRPHR